MMGDRHNKNKVREFQKNTRKGKEWIKKAKRRSGDEAQQGGKRRKNWSR